MRITIFLLLLVAAATKGMAQTAATPIHWQNPSFEGEAQDATVPIGWLTCDPFSTPDILPGFWGVYQPASDGDTYVGLITRADGTWEAMTQRLARTVHKGDCYGFSVDLARGATYSGYNKAIKVRIWGSTDKCDKTQLLLETPLVEHIHWKTYPVTFTAKRPIRYIIIEAFYSEGRFSHKGNVLIDNLTPLRPCPRA